MTEVLHVICLLLIAHDTMCSVLILYYCNCLFGCCCCCLLQLGQPRNSRPSPKRNGRQPGSTSDQTDFGSRRSYLREMEGFVTVKNTSLDNSAMPPVVTIGDRLLHSRSVLKQGGW